MKKLSLFPLRFLLIFFINGSLITHSYAQSNTIGANVGRNINVYPIDTGGNVNVQSEEHISIDKANPSNLIMAANTWDFSVPTNFNNSEGYYYSHDGGNTWSGGDYFPNAPTSIIQLNALPTSTVTTTAVGGDPATAIDADGNMYVVSMTAASQGGSAGYLLNVSHDSGVTWTLKTPTYSQGFDKEMIAADDNPSSAYANNVYVSWHNTGHDWLMFSTYIPSLDSFTTPYRLFPHSGTTTDNGTNIQIGPNGEIFECWSDIDDNTQKTYGFYFCENTKGGDTAYWTTPYIAESFTGIAPNGNTLSEGDFNTTRVNSFPAMGVDRSCGAHRGTVYVAFATQLTSGPDDSDYVIEVTSLAPPYSDTGTDIWTTPKIVSTPSRTYNSFFPWLAVDDITGAVYVDYYSTNNSNWLTDTYMAYSVNGGANYYNVKVTDTSHTLAVISQYSSINYEGDYIGLAAHNGIAYPTWMDSRHSNQVYMAKVTIGPYKINTNTTWSATQSLETDVEVTPTNTLTIASGAVISMGAGHQITVDSGAVLNVSGTITNGGICGNSSLWAGIQVNGNIGQSQTGTHQGTLVLDSGSVIENAVTGISTASGIVTAYRTAFHNNQCDANFSAYTKGNTSSFKNCTFKTDSNYIWITSSPHIYQLAGAARVKMTGVSNILFRGNTFENTAPYSGTHGISRNYDRGSGISSMDASYSVDNCNCEYSTPPAGCCGAANTFEGLYFGIIASNSNSHAPIVVIENTFLNNYADIDVADMNNVVITGNTFSKTAFVGNDPFCIQNCYPPYNIYLDQCTGYNVSGNSFSNTYYTSPGGNGISYGTVVNNSGIANNLVDANTYSGIYVQSQSQGTNGAVQIGYAYPHLYINNTGLQYKCNTYTSSVANGADISVASGLIDNNQGSCVNAYTTTNNAFNYSTCGSLPRSNIDIYPTYSYGINYFWADSSSNNFPSCILGSVTTNSCVSFRANCSPTYTINVISGSVLLAAGTNYNTKLRTQKASFLHIYDSLTQILKRGDTPGLFTIIASGTTPTIILDSLLAPGPYLSDSVLKAAINKTTIPIETLANILIPNTPLDASVVSALDAIGLPDTLVSRLNEYQSDAILSPRAILNAGVNYFQSMMDYTDNALITALQTDASITSAFDSAQAVIKSNPYPLSLPQFAQLASLQWAAGENTTALVTLDTLKKHDADSTYANYRKLLPVLISLSGNSTGYLSLKGNSTDSTLIAQIAMDTLIPGYANARAVLGYVYNKSFAEPILAPSDGSHKAEKRNNNLLITTDARSSSFSTLNSPFNLFPNPANNQLNIQYSLSQNTQSAYVELFDEVGNKVAEWQLSPSQTMATENITSFSPGFYLYSILVNNKAVQRGKLVIAR